MESTVSATKANRKVGPKVPAVLANLEVVGLGLTFEDDGSGTHDLRRSGEHLRSNRPQPCLPTRRWPWHS